MTKEELQICQDLLEVTSLVSLPLKIKYAEKHKIPLGTKDNFLDEVHKHMIDVHIKFRNMVTKQVDSLWEERKKQLNVTDSNNTNS